VVNLENRELSVRLEPRGGDVATQLQIGPDGGAGGHSRVILLLHGYANTLDVARNSYSLFEQNLVQQQQPIGSANLPHIFRLYWPGDSKLMKPLYYGSYPGEIGPAKKSAAPIEEYLRNLPQPPGGAIELFLVAHSLGNRVALELLDCFTGGRRPGRLQIRGVLMMAAAVPVARVRFGGNLHYAASMAERRFTLHSRSDMTLLWGFPAGEIFGGDALALPWDWPQAVGRNGNPVSNWTFHTAMFTTQGEGYGHSNYWPGTEVSDPAAQMLGLVPAQQTPTAKPASNAIATSPGPPAVQPATRNTPTRPPLG